jgi:2-aminoethylphosphonate-pyruvate transaminase
MVNVSERVQAAFMRAAANGTEADGAEWLHGIRVRLLSAFVPGAESDYTAVILPGSGSAAVEAALLSSLPHGKRILVINNGYYGDRLSAMVGAQRLGVAELKFDWSAKPDVEKVRLALRQHPEVHTVVMAHHESSTGQLNPLKEVAEVVDGLNRAFIVDAVGSFASETVDIAGPHIYMAAGASHGGLRGVGGLSFVLIRKGFIDRLKTYPARSWSLHLTHYLEEEDRGTSPSLLPVPLLAAFHEALAELLEEGVPQRVDRCKKLAVSLRQPLAGFKLKPVLPAEQQSHSLTAYHLPDGMSYQALGERMQEGRHALMPGLGPFRDKTFRLSHVNVGTQPAIDSLLEHFRQALASSNA